MRRGSLSAAVEVNHACGGEERSSSIKNAGHKVSQELAWKAKGQGHD